MVRKLNLLLPLLVLLTIVNSAQALGLGDINLKSSLNQPLLAEIELLEEGSMSPGEIIPTLASNDDFVRAGIQREFFLSNLLFRLESQGGNQYILVVYTEEPVQEPFLNFLVEISWPSGRLLKEFTLLLDPPLYDQVSPGSTPVVSMGDTQSSTRTEQVTEKVTTQVPVRSQENLPPGQYRVQRNDTMWEISIQVRPTRSVTPQQVMLAIQDKNPSAFIGGNINRVKEGSLLNIPSEGEIRRWGQAEAIAEIARQNQLLRSGSAVTAAPVTGNSGTASALPDGGEQDPEGYLELVGESEETGSAGGGVVTQVQEELTRALELNDQFERENAELESRLSDLQEQLEILQSLVNLQSDTATAIAAQGQIPEQSSEAGAETSDQSTESESAARADDDDESVVDDELAIGSAASKASTNLENMLAGSSAAAAANSGAEQNPVNDDGVESTNQQAEPETDSSASVATVVEPAPVQQPTPVPPIVAPAQQSFIQYLIDDLSALVFGNPLYAAAAGLVILLLVLLLVNSMMKRRAAKAGDESEENMLDLSDDELEVHDDSDEFASADSEFESNDDIEKETLGSEEVGSDIITEADIYIAYSRYEQAEEILLNAINENGGREDVKLKLAEVYAESGNSDGFARMEEALANSSPDVQQALSDLRKQLSSASPAMSSMLQDNSMDMDMGKSDSRSSDDIFPTLSTEESDSDDLNIEIDDEMSLDDMPSDFDLGDDLVLDSDKDSGSASSRQKSETQFAVDNQDADDGGLEFDEMEFNAGFDHDDRSDDAGKPGQNTDSGLEFDMGSEESEGLGSADDLDLSEDFGGLNEPDKKSDEEDSSDSGSLEFSLDDMDLSTDEEDSDTETSSLTDSTQDDDDLPIDFDAEYQALTESEDDNDIDEDPLASLDRQIAALGSSGKQNDDEPEDDDEQSFSATDFSDEELSDFGFDNDAEPEPEPAAVSNSSADDKDAEVDGDLGDMDLNFDDSEFENLLEGDSGAEDEEILDLSEEELDLSALESDNDQEGDDLSFESEVVKSATDGNNETLDDDGGMDTGGMDLSFDEEDLSIEEPTSENKSQLAAGADDDLRDDDDFDLLAGADEASTKLDLARAYIDMDEQDAAKEILEEVVQEGSEEQITKAQDMLKQISG